MMGSGGRTSQSISRPEGIAAFQLQAPQSLFEELFNVCHRPEQLHRLVGKRQKALTFIEPTSVLILSIDDHRERRDLAAHRSEQRVG